MAYILIVYLHVGLVSHVKDSNVVRQGLLNWMCFHEPHGMGIQRGEWHSRLGFDPGPDTVVQVVEAEFHRLVLHCIMSPLTVKNHLNCLTVTFY